MISGLTTGLRESTIRRHKALQHRSDQADRRNRLRGAGCLRQHPSIILKVAMDRRRQFNGEPDRFRRGVAWVRLISRHPAFEKVEIDYRPEGVVCLIALRAGSEDKPV